MLFFDKGDSINKTEKGGDTVFCKYCGSKVADHSKVCIYCGRPLTDDITTERRQSNIETNVIVSGDDREEKPKNRLTPVLIGMAIGIAVLLTAVVALVVTSSYDNSDVTMSGTEPVPTVEITLPPTEPPTEAPTEPELTEPEVTATEYYAPYTDSRGIYYEIVEPYPSPSANPEKDIYDAPDGNYIGDFNTIGYYTIVEQAEDTNGYTWGKLSTGEGWTMVYQQILPNLDMTFCSGAGAWSTGITIKGTGFFSGNFHDSDMGDGGYNYPYGTVYTCDFDGKFNVVDIGRHGVSLKLADLDSDYIPGNVWYENGIRYISSEPYGLEDCTQFILYIPGTPATQLPDDMKYWLHGAADSGTLSCYALYNPATGDTFVS